jgi:predicted alpha/beta-hydrolase family hydrolase
MPNQPITIEVSSSVRVSGLWQEPASARACLVLAHGAGAGMRHPFMSAVAAALAERAIATLRYQFPYMERGSKRPDPPPLCYATVRAAVAAAASLAPKMSCFAGGKSFGGRMSSQAAAGSPLPSVSGLVFFGFPLHPPGQPGDARGAHLGRLALPMLFLQGTRDAFAELALLEGLVARLPGRATLKLFEGADHSFHVPARSGRTDQQVLAELVDTCSQWMLALAEPH